MGKRLCLILLILLSVSWDSYARQDDPFTSFELQIPANGRYIEYKNGSSFLYLGDTAWSLLSRLTKDEVSLYLKNRKEKGFTVIQTVILPELEAWNERLAIGVPSIVDVDSIRLHPVYLEYIDWVLEEAERLGLFIGLLPTWGDKVDKQWGKGPELFDEKNARNYGRMLGARYADVPNVIWIIGGDRGGDGKNKAIWNAMAEGIKEMDKTHLMTFHPQGEHSSSFWFHQVSFKCRKVFRHRYTLFGTFHECLKLFRYFYFHSNDIFHRLQEFCRMSCFQEQADFSFFQFFSQRTVSACSVRIEQITRFFIHLLHRFTYLFISIGFTADFRSNGIVTTFVQIQYPGKITGVAYIHSIGNSSHRRTRTILSCL